MLIKKFFGVLSKKERLALVIALAVFLLSGTAKAVIFIEENTEVVPARGGEFREGVLGQPVSINPVVPVSDVDQGLARLMFSDVRQVADSVKSGDGKTWSVRLKENVFWQDGVRLTSDDVIFTVDSIQNPEAHSPLSPSFQGILSERVSELEVKFILPSSYAFFEEDHLKNLLIIPKHIFADIPVQNFKLSVYSLRPIGSGPYKIVSYAKDRSGWITNLYLEENKNYFADKPNIGKLIFKFYKNEGELIAAYNAGLLDGAGFNTSYQLQGKIEIRNQISYFKSPRYYSIFINQIEGQKDLKIRMAMSGVVDRGRIIGEVFDGQATPMYGPTPLSEPATRYDEEALRGIELNLTIPDEPFLVKTASIVKEKWEAGGAKVNLKTMSLKDVQEQVLKNNDYEMLLFGNIVKESQDLFSFWHSSRRFYPGQNLSLYGNRRVDELLESYRRNFDSEARTKTLKTVSDIIGADLPAIFLYSPHYVYVTTPNLQGFDKNKLINIGADRFSDIEKWYVKTKRVFRS